MALAPTLYEFQVELHQVDRGVEQQFSVRLARHPSETLERLWLRLLGYCWQWREGIAVGPGISDPEQPDILATDLTGEVVLWMRVGKVDVVKLQRERDRHPRAEVVVLFDSPDRLGRFREELAREGGDLERIQVAAAAPELLQALAEWDARRTKLSLTVVGDHLYLESDGVSLDGPLSAGEARGVA
jgi:uncharacterized protein YaeQ